MGWVNKGLSAKKYQQGNEVSFKDRAKDVFKEISPWHESQKEEGIRVQKEQRDEVHNEKVQRKNELNEKYYQLYMDHKSDTDMQATRQDEYGEYLDYESEPEVGDLKQHQAPLKDYMSWPIPIKLQYLKDIKQPWTKESILRRQEQYKNQDIEAINSDISKLIEEKAYVIREHKSDSLGVEMNEVTKNMDMDNPEIMEKILNVIKDYKSEQSKPLGPISEKPMGPELSPDWEPIK